MIKALINHSKLLSVLSLAFLFMACEEDNTMPAQPDQLSVPDTYSFENVDYSGQTARIQMLDLLVSKVKSAHDGQTKVTAQELIDIYLNTSGDLFGSSKNLADKTYSADDSTREAIFNYFNQVEALSGHPENVIDGRLYNDLGVEPAQMIEKGLMGSVFYWQAVSGYLGPEKMNVDNTEVTEGKGTAMEHHWDEAFGYFGAPADFNDPNEQAWYWAKYARARSEYLDAGQKIFDAFLRGRAAISAGDMNTRNEAIVTIRENWELLAAANAIHYINSSLKDIEAGTTADLYHHWSEGKAFLNALKYNEEKNISDEALNELNGLFKESPKEVTKEDLEAARQKLQSVFGFSDTQVQNF